MESASSATPKLAPQTFLDDLEPAIQFVAPAAEQVSIPTGLLTCCRVVHQPDCDHYIAKTLVAAASVRTFEDGTKDEWIHPMPVSFDGDALVEPTKLFSAVKIHWLLARETAARMKATVTEMTVGVFLLSAEQAIQYQAIYRDALERAVELQANTDRLDADQIAALAFKEILDPEEMSLLMMKPSFRTPASYAPRVPIVPGEVGHDEEYRYLDRVIWPAPDQEAMPWMPDPESPEPDAVSLDPS